MQYASEDSIPTPAMVIDPKAVERNLAGLAAYCAKHNLKLRPHTKTHKSIQMAKRQIAHGAIGLTVAKVGEAEVMLNASTDLLLAYPMISIGRIDRLAELARDLTIRVALDTRLGADFFSDAAKRAGSTLGVLVDLDVGFHRTGVQDVASAVALAKHVASKPGLRFDGLFFFPGHLKPIGKGPEHHAALRGISELLRENIKALTAAGLNVGIVSGGSTPTAFESHMIPEQTEIRPGTYIYNDWNTAYPGLVSKDDCAAQLICTVISDAVPNKVVIDAGSKTLTNDRLAGDPENGGHGHLPAFPEAKIVRLSEEHGEVDISKCSVKPKIGQRVRVIPNHICPCINLQDFVWLKNDDGSLSSLPVDARGKLA